MPGTARSALLLGLALLATLVIALCIMLSPGGAPIARAPASESSPEPPRAGELDSPTATTAALAAREEAPARSEPVPAAPPAAASEARTGPDLAAREWILFRVKDDHGTPVSGAEIRLTGLRRKRERGSHYGWRGDPSLGRTSVAGTLKLAYPVWIDPDDETAEISFTVSHPDYVTLNDIGREVAPEIDIVLQRGSVLVVSGWIDSPDHVVTNVSPRFSADVELSAEDWLPRRDGRLTTTRMPPGFHIVYLHWESAEHGTRFSDLTEFELVEGQNLELHLELHAPRALIGRLDDEVPRPIVDGTVEVGVQLASSKAQRAWVLTKYVAPVRPDGTFELEGMLAGEAQVVGLCRGWASSRVLARDPAEEDSPADLGSRAWVLPSVDLRSWEGAYVLDMEPAASLELTLRGPDGQPAPGVEVHAWPNACWRVHVCGSYSRNGTWSATSNASGVARIDDLPPGEHFFGVSHPELDLPFDTAGAGEGSRHRTAKFLSGETTRSTLELVRKTAR